MKTTLLLFCLLVAACSAPVAAATPTPPPDQPITGTPGPVLPGPSDGAQPVQPEPGIRDAHPVSWDHVTVAADGRTITVYFYGGEPACYGIASADAAVDANGVLQLRILEGWRAALPPGTACDDMAVLKSVTLLLDQPIIAPAH